MRRTAKEHDVLLVPDSKYLTSGSRPVRPAMLTELTFTGTETTSKALILNSVTLFLMPLFSLLVMLIAPTKTTD